MSNRFTAPRFETLITTPWGETTDHSYYGDPRHVNKEQHGLEHIERDQVGEEGIEQVVILGYN